MKNNKQIKINRSKIIKIHTIAQLHKLSKFIDFVENMENYLTFDHCLYVSEINLDF